MKTFWKTYVAIALLAALGAYIYFVERKRPADTNEKTREKVFASLDRGKVQELTLTPANGDVIHLARQGAGWVMTAPMSVRASTTDVDTLLGSLENLEMNEVVSEDGANASSFGLDHPQLTVGVLEEGQKQPLELQLGAKTPDDSNVYARIASAPRIFTLSGYVEKTFEKKPLDLRDRDLLHVKRDDVATLTVTGPNERYALKRAGKDHWVFSEPFVTWAGRWSVDGLLGSLESLRMDAVAEEPAKDLKKYGLAPPQRTVTLGLGKGKTETLEIGKAAPDDKFYARASDSDLVAIINKTIVDDLAKGMDNVRAKRLLDVSAYDVNGFDALFDGVQHTYQRSSSKDKDGIEVYKWKRTTPNAKDLETNPVQDVLFKIGGVDVAEFVDKPQPDPSYGLDKPVLKVTLRFVEGKPSTSFEVAHEGDSWYARRPGDHAVLRLDSSKAEDLLKGFKGL
jgi:hypothetical protein